MQIRFALAFSAALVLTCGLNRDLDSLGNGAGGETGSGGKENDAGAEAASGGDASGGDASGPCGKESEPCCTSDSGVKVAECASDLVCGSGTCMRCATPGADCCKSPTDCGNYVCSATLECMPCGALGERCCNGSTPCTGTSVLCDTGPAGSSFCKVCCYSCWTGCPKTAAASSLQTCQQAANAACTGGYQSAQLSSSCGDTSCQDGG